MPSRPVSGTLFEVKLCVNIRFRPRAENYDANFTVRADTIPYTEVSTVHQIKTKTGTKALGIVF